MSAYPGSVYERELGDGRILVVYSMIYNDRICLGPAGWPTYDRAFCYPKGGAAVEAAERWDGEGDPPGEWIKETGTDRRRDERTRA